MSLEAAELSLEARAGAGNNVLPVLSNTTLELTFTGADALGSGTTDSFAIPSTDGHGETHEEFNMQCLWIYDCGEVNDDGGKVELKSNLG